MGCGESQMCTFRETPTHPNKALEERAIVFQRSLRYFFFQSRFLRTDDKKITLFSEPSNYSLTKLITKSRLITSSSHVLLIHLRGEYRKTTLRNYHSTHRGMLVPCQPAYFIIIMIIVVHVQWCRHLINMVYSASASSPSAFQSCRLWPVITSSSRNAHLI